MTEQERIIVMRVIDQVEAMAADIQAIKADVRAITAAVRARVAEEAAPI